MLTTEREPEGPAQRSNFRNEGIFLFASFAVIMIFIKNFRNEGIFLFASFAVIMIFIKNFRNEGIILFASKT